MKVVALAGGVGGAKLVDGLAAHLSPGELSVVVNIGDDFEHLGLYICPDLDTVCYTLAGIANPETGWGRADETWNAFDSLVALGGPGWFHLGDRDLGTHLERTRRLRAGEPLSQVTRDFCLAWGVSHTVLPASDQRVPTLVHTEEGVLPFQEYFVHRACQPRVTGFSFECVAQARPAPGVLPAILAADLAILCPSNPWVSIDPILAIPGISQALHGRTTLAVTPIIGGKTVKGPAAKMYVELGIHPSALAVARHYSNLISGFVLDVQDEELSEPIRSLGLQVLVTDTLMRDRADRLRLAGEVIEFGERLLSRAPSNEIGG